MGCLENYDHEMNVDIDYAAMNEPQRNDDNEDEMNVENHGNDVGNVIDDEDN